MRAVSFETWPRQSDKLHDREGHQVQRLRDDCEGAMSENNSSELLFGIFALQFNFISRDDLIAVATAWSKQPTGSVANLLVDRGALTDDRRALLEQLIAEHHKSASENSLESMVSASSLWPVERELRALGNPSVDETFDRIAAGASFGVFSGTDGDGEETVRAPDAADPQGRFRVLRPHAHGGLGHVSVAYDNELNREVALKEIHAQLADNEENRARFVQEAEITGSLEHPGIVPVYGLGTQSNGRPFYVMRFVHGDTLKEAIKKFHETSPNTGDRALQLRQLLGRFVDVCNAVEYAHSRGVLHRDLKPGNVMLGRYGETLVVDWGLAKSVGREDRHTGSGEVTIRPSGSGSTLTLDGQAVGTPAYMSPEQAEGRLDTLGPTTDVYSLGATLYCILTGHPPFEGAKGRVLLPRVAAGDFQPPRAVNSSVAPGLNAICLKAMALEPRSRYKNPSDLAMDVERWMADEPVTAFRDPIRDRMARFLRRHKSWTVAGAGAVCLVAVCASLAAVMVNSARLATTQQLYATNALRLAAIAESLGDGTPNRSGLAALAAIDTSVQHGLPPAPEARSVVCNTLGRMAGHFVTDFGGPVYDMQVSPDDGTLLISSHRNDRWKLDLTANPVAATMLTKAEPTTASGVERRAPQQRYLSPDWSQQVHVRHRDSVIEVINVANGSRRELRGLDQPRVRSTSLVVTSDGRWVGVTAPNRGLVFWDLDDPGDSPKYEVGAQTWHTDIQLGARDLVLTRRSDGIQVWRLSNEGLVEDAIIKPDIGTSFTMKVSPDGRWLIAIPRRGSKHQVWDLLPESRPSRVFLTPFTARTGKFSPDGRRVVMYSDDGDTAVVRLDQEQPTVTPLPPHSGGILHVVFDSRSERLALSGWDDRVSVWDLTNESPAELAEIESHDGAIQCAAFSSVSQTLYTGDTSGLIRRVNLNRYQDTDSVRRFKVNTDVKQIMWRAGTSEVFLFGNKLVQTDFESPDKSKVLVDHFVRGEVSTDGKSLLSQSTQELTVFDLTNPDAEPNVFPLRLKALMLIDVSADRNWLASSGDGTVWEREGDQWINKSGKKLADKMYWDMRVSPDSKSVAIPGHSVRIWALSDFDQPLLELETTGGILKRVKYSDDGRWLAAGGDGPTFLWDLKSPDPNASRQTFTGHTSSTQGIAFSPSGRWLATSSSDATVRLRDLTGDPHSDCIILRPGKNTMSCVTFSPDNKWLLSGDHEGNVYAWSLDFGAIVDELRERIGRKLTAEERREFRIEEN